MNGKKAKMLREEARALNGDSRYTDSDRTWHGPAPLRDWQGRVIALADRFTDRCNGFRREYQDLKRAEGYRRSGTRILSEAEVEKLRAVLARFRRGR